MKYKRSSGVSVIYSVMMLNSDRVTVPVVSVKKLCGYHSNSNSIFCLCMAHVGKNGRFGSITECSSLAYRRLKKKFKGTITCVA